jgi:hypothetical protein
MKLKTPLSSHGLQFLALDTIVGYIVWFIDYLIIVRQTTYSHHLTHPRFLTVMNYHCGIAQDSTCNYRSSLSLSIIWINASFIMKFMLPLPPYHTIYLIVKLFQINLTLIMFEDYSISIGPFIDTLSIVSWISNILIAH